MTIKQTAEFKQLDNEMHKAIAERRYEDVKELQNKLVKACNHANQRLYRECMTQTLGRVVCLDCGYEREWNAY